MTAWPLTQINIIVSDLDATIAFYERLGWNIRRVGGSHAEAHPSGDVSVEFDTGDSAAMWDRGYRGGTGGTTVLTVSVSTRADVDTLFEELSRRGKGGRQEPYDAFWGSRFAVVGDPDGNPVGIMSPSDPDAMFEPSPP
jgi:uncharacterized glyoxalase superfamily protein PhnB